MPKRKHNDDASGSFARLDVFVRGMIWGMHVAKASREDICNEVVKKDVRPPSIQAVDQVIAHMKVWPILPRQPPAWFASSFCVGSAVFPPGGALRIRARALRGASGSNSQRSSERKKGGFRA